MTASRASQVDPEGGFTLIELLVTLALLSMLTLTLYGSIHYGTRIWDVSKATAATSDSVRDAQARIAETIAGAYPKSVSDGALHPSVDFDGEAASVRVLAADPQLPGGFAHFTIRTQTIGSRPSLVMEREAELAATNASEAPEVLVSGVRAVSFQYFGPEKPGRQPKWWNSWKQKTHLPQLVRVRVELAEGRIAWPELVVAPQIDGDVSCAPECGGL